MVVGGVCGDVAAALPAMRAVLGAVLVSYCMWGGLYGIVLYTVIAVVFRESVQMQSFYLEVRLGHLPARPLRSHALRAPPFLSPPLPSRRCESGVLDGTPSVLHCAHHLGPAYRRSNALRASAFAHIGWRHGTIRGCRWPWVTGRARYRARFGGFAEV
ncbi:hypothetical protein OH77DRAFT_676827 [Trametes cingulata]|nr:hypothetical protein OH77DRAFT_676827 [Trametes cingulata]